jgi:hypothetical protein
MRVTAWSIQQPFGMFVTGVPPSPTTLFTNR